MDEAQTTPGNTIDLQAPENQAEHQVTLTLGQIKLIEMLIEANLQPKGYEMIKLVYELFERLQVETTESEEEEDTKEAFD